MNGELGQRSVATAGLLLGAATAVDCSGGPDPATSAIVVPAPTDAEPATAPAASAAAPRARIAGELRGFRLGEADAAFVVASRGPGRGEWLVLVLSDVADVCQAMHQGHMRLEVFEQALCVPDSVFLAWTVIGRDDAGRPGAVRPATIPFAVPRFEGPSARPPPPSGSYGFVQLGATGGDGRSTLVRYPVADLQGELTIDMLDARPGGEARGSFDLRLSEDDSHQRLGGRFRARYCPMPANPKPRGCHAK